jgi:hypothetical protein
MAIHAEIEAPKAIAAQAISAALKYNRVRSVICHDSFDDRLKDVLVRGVGDAVAQRKVDRIVLALANAYVA